MLRFPQQLRSTTECGELAVGPIEISAAAGSRREAAVWGQHQALLVDELHRVLDSLGHELRSLDVGVVRGDHSESQRLFFRKVAQRLKRLRDRTVELHSEEVDLQSLHSRLH